jgi:hydroxymethylpyrimidine pyrophosphatase-like HAD family hydrolase
MQKPLYIVDIDDNLGHAASKCEPGSGPLTLMSVDRDGQPGSFMTPKQVAFFEHLRTTGNVVPCTGRDRAGLGRMRIPLDGWAIVSFGGAIVQPDGSFEPRWQTHVQTESARVSAIINELLLFAQGTCQHRGWDIRCEIIGERFREDELTPLFVQMKQRKNATLADMDALQAMVSPLVPTGWRIHRNSNTLALLPPFLRKGLALQFFLNELAPAHPFTVGMGDSTDDAGYMAVCDYAMMPTRSQIFGSISKEVTDVSR